MNKWTNSKETTIKAALEAGSMKLQPMENTRLDAELILSHVLSISRSLLYVSLEEKLLAAEEEAAAKRANLEARAKAEAAAKARQAAKPDAPSRRKPPPAEDGKYKHLATSPGNLSRLLKAATAKRSSHRGHGVRNHGLRTLLATLPSIWPAAENADPLFSDGAALASCEAGQVRKCYLKAVRLVHPDKLQGAQDVDGEDEDECP